MSFERIRTIKGNEYLYREERWREGGKVKSRSIYLGVLRKRKALSYSDEQQEKERLEQERIDRMLAYALRSVEKDQKRKAKEAEIKKAPATKSEGPVREERSEPSSGLKSNDASDTE